MNTQHMDTSLDEFLQEDGRLAEAEAVAAKRVLAFQIARLMEEQQMSKTQLARRPDARRRCNR